MTSLAPPASSSDPAPTGRAIGPAVAPATAAAAPARLGAVDAARTMAIIGMFVSHLSGAAAQRWTFLHWVNGYAAGGFAVLAGVSMGLTRRMAVPGWRAWPPQLARSVLLFALGVALAGISFGPVVILCVYAALFLVALPFRRLGGRALVAVGLVLTVVWPPLSLWLRTSVVSDAVVPGYHVDWAVLTGPRPVATVARTLFLDGLYPVFTWLPLALVGWGVVRCGLLGRERLGRLAVVSAALVTIGFGGSAVVEAATDTRAELIDQLAADSASGRGLVRYGSSFDSGLGVPNSARAEVLLTGGHHTGTTFELWQILGVTGGFVTAFSLLERGSRRLVGAAGLPGRIPLTAYTAHLVVGWPMDTWKVGLGLAPVPQALVLAAFVAGAFVLGWLFRRRRGPLEAVLHRAARWATPSRGAAVTPSG